MTADLDVRADLAEELVPIACRLVGVVHDEGPAAVAAVLASVPDGRLDALLVVVAAMVDPDRSARELLAWLPPQDPAERQLHHAERVFRRLVDAGVSPLPASHLATDVLRRGAA